MNSFTKRNARAFAKERLKKSLHALASDPNKSCSKLVKASIVAERENIKVKHQKAIANIRKSEAISQHYEVLVKKYEDYAVGCTDFFVMYSKDFLENQEDWERTDSDIEGMITHYIEGRFSVYG